MPTTVVSIVELGVAGSLEMSYQKISNVFSDPVEAMFQGTAPHLWFLPSLALRACINAAFFELQAKWGALACSLALFVVGVLGGSYTATPMGLDLKFNTRNGPFMGFMF